MTISSQASKEEGSETIESVSNDTVSRVHSKQSGSAKPPLWGEDIVQSSWKREAVLKLLINKMEKNQQGCWEWQGSLTLGYGSFKIPNVMNDIKIMAHRASYVAFKGEPIHDGLFVCHHCDNPKCFNPDHLFLGTQKENINDCSDKGRLLSGMDSNLSTYNDTEINKVQSLLKQGKTGVEISILTGVSKTHISRIKNGYSRKGKDYVNHNRKTSDEQIIKIVELLKKTKMKHSEIASIVGVSKYLVGDISKGKSYREFMKRVL